MPWIIALRGKSFTFKTDDGYALETEIEKNDKFKAASNKLDELGLYSIFIVNSDDDELVLSVGKELHKDRHIFQGLTVTLDDLFSTDNKENIDAVCAEIENALNEMTLEYEVKEGLVLGQFD